VPSTTAAGARRVLAPLLAAALLPALALTAAPASAQDAAFAQREAANYARTGQAPSQQLSDPAFVRRWQEQSLANSVEFNALGPQRRLATQGNVCREWAEQCTGDPYLYPGVDPFYDRADVVPVSFLDRGGAQLFGRVWAPKGATGRLPGVVIVNGSVQAPETLYWWGAQALVDAGYVVMTFDPRGQGRSDNRTPSGQQGSNANPAVFATGAVDAIDFFHSTPEAPYEGNVVGDPRQVTAFNPLHARVDRTRLGAVGHSLGARGVSVVQGAQPWPGTGDANPIDAVVAWDNLALSEGGGADGGLAGIPLVPRVPAMGQAGDYFLTPTPYTSPPPRDGKRGGFLTWQRAGVPSYQLVVEGGTHYEWSLLPTFPTTAWEAGGEGGWGNPLAKHFTVAWLDRWLKAQGEPGFADADARLTGLTARPAASDLQGGSVPASWCERLSFHFASSYDFPARDGSVQRVDDLAASCEAQAAAAATGQEAPPAQSPPAAGPPGTLARSLPATGGLPALAALGLLGAAAALRRLRRWSTASS
jgi:dienelactone hydrolase